MAVTRVRIPEWAKTQKSDNRLELSLSEIDLVVRTVNCLEDHGIFTVQDLLSSTPQQLLEIPNLGEKTLETIYQALEKIGFYRPGRQPEGPVQVQLPPKGFALFEDQE
jgi:DNA-directed RNA polymerase subunit alpha